jgi:hypothetical protein
MTSLLCTHFIRFAQRIYKRTRLCSTISAELQLKYNVNSYLWIQNVVHIDYANCTLCRVYSGSGRRSHRHHRWRFWVTDYGDKRGSCLWGEIVDSIKGNTPHVRCRSPDYKRGRNALLSNQFSFAENERRCCRHCTLMRLRFGGIIKP